MPRRIWILIAGNIGVTLILLFLMELVSFLIVRPDCPNMPFLISVNHAPSQQAEAEFTGEIRGHQQIDALTGWSETDDNLRKKGHTVEHGCIVLTATKDTLQHLRILITGGSTSDVDFYPYNWPVQLIGLLHDRGINARIYAGAVIGYHSGQELLKLIRDGLEIQPDIHISYSGANEGFSPGYVTAYEQNLFLEGFPNRPYSILMPNTIFLLRNLLGMNQYSVSPLPRKKLSPEIFWQRNMRIMQGVAHSHGYHFVGALQPVVGSGIYTQPVPEEFASIVDLYRRFYPVAKKFKDESDYMEDLSAVFDTAKGKVYLDHCHVDSAHQHVIANSIYEILERRGLLKL